MCWDVEESKDAPLSCASQAVVDHNEPKNDSRESDGTLVCNLGSDTARPVCSRYIWTAEGCGGE